MKKILPVANGLALIVTIIINYLSNTGVFNGNTMATVSARYPSLFTPAPYAFTIWIVIYISLLGFVVYQGRSLRGNEEAAIAVQQVGWWFVLSCLANCAWILAWLYDLTGLSVLIMVALLFCLLRIIWRTDMELTDPPLRTIAGLWWPFCWYFGWITSALLANISAWFTKIGWSGFGLPPAMIAIIMIILAGAVYLFMTWRRNIREAAFVGVWALVAIAVADFHRSPAVTRFAVGMAAILFVSSSIHGYMNRAFSPWRKRPAPPSSPNTGRLG
jgi:hypothetical protein